MAAAQTLPIRGHFLALHADADREVHLQYVSPSTFSKARQDLGMSHEVSHLLSPLPNIRPCLIIAYLSFHQH